MNNKLSNYVKTFLVSLSFLVFLISSSNVFAGDATSTGDATGIVTIFCNVINEITGGIGKVISVLILISMAIGLFLGKITWGLAISVMVGMGLLFGATGIVDLMSAGTTTDNTSTESLCTQTT